MKIKETMTDWKPTNINEALEDIIGGALNDSIECEDKGGGDTGTEYINTDDINGIVAEAVQGILDSRFIKVEFKEEK